MNWTTQLDWSHLTLVDIFYTISVVATGITSTMSWITSRRNTKIGHLTSSRVNGYLTNLSDELRQTKDRLMEVTAENERLKAEKDQSNGKS